MESRTTETVSIEREKLLEMARDLNTLVVSLDRIGSYPVGRREFERVLAEFIVEWKISEKLVRARRTVADALLGPNPTPEEEEALDHGDYWEPPPQP
jgi:hypothetical protein